MPAKRPRRLQPCTKAAAVTACPAEDPANDPALDVYEGGVFTPPFDTSRQETMR
jgi:hypothetical protein